MRPSDEVKQYSDAVCAEIRWKKARQAVAQELEAHVCDQRDAYLKAGMEEPAATQKAVAQMGDAIAVGQALDRTHRPAPQWSMLTLTGVLIALGALGKWTVSFLYYASLGHRDPAGAAWQLFNGWPYVAAFAVLLLCYCADFTLLGKYAVQCYWGVLGLGAVCLLCGTPINGVLSFAWPNVTIRLSHLALVLPLAYALLIYAMRGRGVAGILLCGVGIVPPALLLLFIPSMAGVLALLLTGLVLLCTAIARGWFGGSKQRGLLLVLGPTAAALSIPAAILLIPSVYRDYAWYKMQFFFHPEWDVRGNGYWYSTVRGVLEQARFWGKNEAVTGIGATEFLPNITTELSLTYLIGELGLVVLAAVVALLALFAALGVWKALRQRNMLGTLVALALVCGFVLQAALAVAKSVGYSPFSYLPLPFFEDGTFTLLLNAALTGFLLSVFRTGEACCENAPHIQDKMRKAPRFTVENGVIRFDCNPRRPLT